jgi:hypothetical protein
LIWLLLALSGSSPLDYSAPGMWLMQPENGQPGLGDEGLQISVDGDLQVLEPAETGSAGVDCFYVYPTVDMSLKPGQHSNIDELSDPERITRWQALGLASACTLWVPKYRQATIGSFSGPKGQPFLDSAYQDVLDAFEHFAQSSQRPFVLVGHSQGSLHLSRLIEERVAQDPALTRRLVVAWLPGSPRPITDALPSCEDSTSLGCTVSFRSFREGNKVPPFAGKQPPVVSCQNPANWGSESWAPLSWVLIPNVGPWKHEDAHPDAELVRYEDAFEARCTQSRTGHQGLELRWTGSGKGPIPNCHPQSSGNFGTHVLDLAMVQGEIVADIRRRSP